MKNWRKKESYESNRKIKGHVVRSSFKGENEKKIREKDENWPKWKNWESRDQRAKRCQNGGTRLKLARLN
jgi:hypothetical protein